MPSQRELKEMFLAKKTSTIAWKANSTATPRVVYGDSLTQLTQVLSSYCRSNLSEETGRWTVRVAVPTPGPIPTIIDVVGNDHNCILAAVRWTVTDDIFVCNRP
jgi:hypothetical protein